MVGQEGQEDQEDQEDQVAEAVGQEALGHWETALHACNDHIRLWQSGNWHEKNVKTKNARSAAAELWDQDTGKLIDEENNIPMNGWLFTP